MKKTNFLLTVFFLLSTFLTHAQDTLPKMRGVEAEGRDFLNSMVSAAQSQMSGVIKLYLLILFFIFILILLAIFLPIYFNYRKSKAKMRLYTTMIERGEKIPDNLIPSSSSRAQSDLRKSIILISVGVGCSLFLLLISSSGNSWAIGVIPVIIGLGYFLSSKIAKKSEPSDN